MSKKVTSVPGVDGVTACVGSTVGMDSSAVIFDD